jgi:hypothetical protein
MFKKKVNEQKLWNLSIDILSRYFPDKDYSDKVSIPNVEIEIVYQLIYNALPKLYK